MNSAWKRVFATGIAGIFLAFSLVGCSQTKNQPVETGSNSQELREITLCELLACSIIWIISMRRLFGMTTVKLSPVLQKNGK